MSTSHTIISIGALMLLSTLLMGFNHRAAMSAFDIGTSKDNLAMVALASSYIERAQSLAFDSYSDTASVPLGGLNLLTPVNKLGRDAGEDSLALFNDFDDLHGFDLVTPGTDGKEYRAEFTVNYVNPDNTNSISSTQTFAKRLDVRLWRVKPVPASNERTDTVRMNYVMGYFLFE